MKNIKVISMTENNYKVTNEHTLEEWKKDYWGECNFVPTNNDNVIFVSVDGKEIALEEIADKAGDGQFPVEFEHVAKYLEL